MVEQKWVYIAPQQFARETKVRMKQVGRTLLGEPTPRRVKRWMRHGAYNQSSGKFVKLECFRVSGELFTTVEAYQRFLERLNGG